MKLVRQYHNSRHDGFMFELTEEHIQKKVSTVESGMIQVTLKKCAYTMGFEQVPQDLSRDSVDSTFHDEGYSNRYESRELQERTWETDEQTDQVFETGVRSAIGKVNGLESSKSIEKLLGMFNKTKGVSK